MAVPFYIPDEEEASSGSSGEGTTTSQSSPASSVPNTPSRPIPIPNQQNNNNNSQSPQYSPIDNEMLVQAFYEALCRCSQEIPGFALPTPPMSPSSPFNRGGHFWFPSPPPQSFFASTPSGSVASSPRNSFRGAPRQRLNSYGSHSQYSHYSDELNEEFEHYHADLEEYYLQRGQMEEFPGRVPQPKSNAKSSNKKSEKKPKEEHKRSSRITSFFISALQYVIDTLS